MTNLKLRENPLLVIRNSLSLTRNQVANATQMTVGAVLKYEQGLYEEPSCNIINFYAKEFNLDPVGLKADYTAWRHWKRINAYLPSPKLISVIGEYHPLVMYRRAVGYESVLSFCVELCLHPGVVAKYEKGMSKTMPAQVKKALSEAGWSRDEIAIIQQYGADYSELIKTED